MRTGMGMRTMHAPKHRVFNDATKVMMYSRALSKLYKYGYLYTLHVSRFHIHEIYSKSFLFTCNENSALLLDDDGHQGGEPTS